MAAKTIFSKTEITPILIKILQLFLHSFIDNNITFPTIYNMFPKFQNLVPKKYAKKVVDFNIFEIDQFLKIC